MALIICCAVRFAVTSAEWVQSVSLSAFLQVNVSIIRRAITENLRVLVFHDHDSPTIDSVLDVWSGGPGSGLPKAL